MSPKFRMKMEYAKEQHANVCPICTKTSPLHGVKLRRKAGTFDSDMDPHTIEWQCPHCEAWIDTADEDEDADLIR